MREFVVINEEKIPMVICLWNHLQADEGKQIAQRIRQLPVIVGLRFKATTFYSLSLSSQGISYVMINPPFSDATILRSWYYRNKTEIDGLLENRAFKDGSRLLVQPSPIDVIDLQTAVNTLTFVKTAWVAAEIHLLKGPFRRWYTACGNCHKGLRAEPNLIIKCFSCKEETAVQVRCRIPVVLKDDNAEITAFLFTPDAESFIPFSALQLREADEKNLPLDEELTSAIAGQKVVCFLKYFEKLIHGQVTRRYAIIKTYYQRSIFSSYQNYINMSESWEKNKAKDSLLTMPSRILDGVVVGPLCDSGRQSGPSGLKSSLTISEACPLPSSGSVEDVRSKAAIVYKTSCKRKIADV